MAAYTTASKVSGVDPDVPGALTNASMVGYWRASKVFGVDPNVPGASTVYPPYCGKSAVEAELDPLSRLSSKSYQVVVALS